MPSYFREPNINLGTGFNKMFLHIVGKIFKLLFFDGDFNKYVYSYLTIMNLQVYMQVWRICILKTAIEQLRGEAEGNSLLLMVEILGKVLEFLYF